MVPAVEGASDESKWSAHSVYPPPPADIRTCSSASHPHDATTFTRASTTNSALVLFAVLTGLEFPVEPSPSCTRFLS